MNRKQVLGLITITAIVGGTGYCIYKHLKEKEAKEQTTEISLKEAREIVERSKKEAERALDRAVEVAQEIGMSTEEIEEMIDEARDEASWNASYTQAPKHDEYDFYDGLDYTRPLSEYITEEDKTLRFDPNTIQARDQFIKMELADLLPSSREYQLMKRLFEFQFEPLNDGDDILRTQLEDYRQEFFGPTSRWTTMTTMADIICHYARLLDFNVGGGVGHWIIELAGNTGINEIASSQEISRQVTLLNQHLHSLNDEEIQWGIFGLHVYDMQAAQDIADNTIDGEVTYEIEFNEFVKKVM